MFGTSLVRACLLASVLLHLVLRFATAEKLELIIVNGGRYSYEVKWLQGGIDDVGEGVYVGQLPASQHLPFGVGNVGHAFRLDRDGLRSAPFAYQSGGSLNVVGAAERTDGTIDIELMGPKELYSMVIRIYKLCAKFQDRAEFRRCAVETARFPTMSIVWPDDLVSRLVKELSPKKNAPKLVEKQEARRSDYGLIAPDEFVLLHRLPYAVQMRWAMLAEDPKDGLIVSSSDGSKIANIPPATGGEVSSIRVKAMPGQMFFVLSSKSVGSRQSVSFLYPGEHAVAVVIENASTSLAVEVLSEDDLKVLLSNVAQSCGEFSGDAEFGDCLAQHARMPSTSFQLPADECMNWFKMLWVSVDHWRLCSYQPPSIAVENMTIEIDVAGATRRLHGEVLRKEPLVLAIHDVASKDECEKMIEIGGYDMGMAHVDGGGTSRGRRTLAQNLYPNLAEPGSVLTQLATRFFDVTRTVTGYKLYPEGQEPVNWLYYKPGYEYRPHCDGNCGSRVRTGDRVASSLLYCAVAEEGGGTVFPPAQLKLQPSVGMMLLFTYNPDPQQLSQHAACPVLKGHKLTATQWYREGVSKTRNWERIRKEL